MSQFFLAFEVVKLSIEPCLKFIEAGDQFAAKDDLSFWWHQMSSRKTLGFSIDQIIIILKFLPFLLLLLLHSQISIPS